MHVNIFHMGNRSYWLVGSAYENLWRTLSDLLYHPLNVYSNTEEADTWMILHASSLSRQIGRIIIHSDDTDVLLLSVFYFTRGHLTDHFHNVCWNSEKEHYITGHLIANEIGPSVCECLPAVQGVWYHIFSEQKRQEVYSKLVTHNYRHAIENLPWM